MAGDAGRMNATLKWHGIPTFCTLHILRHISASMKPHGTSPGCFWLKVSPPGKDHSSGLKHHRLTRELTVRHSHTIVIMPALPDDPTSPGWTILTVAIAGRPLLAHPTDSERSAGSIMETIRAATLRANVLPIAPTLGPQRRG